MSNYHSIEIARRYVDAALPYGQVPVQIVSDLLDLIDDTVEPPRELSRQPTEAEWANAYDGIAEMDMR